MKKIILLLFSFIGFLSSSQAQISISASSFTAASIPGTTDTMSLVTGALPNALNTGTNMAWNISNVVYDVFDTAMIIHNAATGYTYSDNSAFFIGTGVSINTHPFYTLNSSALQENGFTTEYWSLGLSGLVGGAAATDSVIYPVQTVNYSSALTKIPFPCTYDTNWQSAYRSDLNFTITLTPVYSNTPGISSALFTETDTVVGWGTMVVKNSAWTASVPVNVLQVKVLIHEVDSFFIGGSPAPATLLTSFQLTQGQVKKYYEHRYYRLGDVTPLASVKFNDSTYSSAQASTTAVLMRNLPSAAAIQSIVKGNEISVYPNPLEGNVVFVNLPGKCNYNLIDILGRGVQTGAIQNGKIDLHNNHAGIYYLMISNEEGKTYSSKLEIK